MKKTAKKATSRKSVVDQAIAEGRALTAAEKKGLSKAELERYRKDHPGVKEQRAILHPVPTLGRIVHYTGSTTGDGNAEAAIITKGSSQHDGRVSLLVLGEQATYRATDIPYSEVGASGSWRWPPRVDDVVTYEPVNGA